jgi:hypothetical protein
MKSTLRTGLAAAAMLLVPVGAMLAAQPAAAQQRDHDADRDYGYQQRVIRDRAAPRIFDITPAQSDRVTERGRTRISARFDDNRSGVDLRTVSLRVDGRDVTGRARLDSGEIRYADDLRPGRHVAELVVRDRAGNAARRSWTFDVVDRGRNVGYGYGNDRRW